MMGGGEKEKGAAHEEGDGCCKGSREVPDLTSRVSLKINPAR